MTVPVWQERDSVAAAIEAAATPNGVFGTVLLDEDATRLRARPSRLSALTAVLPNLHVIVIGEPAGWARALASACHSVVRVSLADAMTYPHRSARRVIRALAL